MSKSKLLAGVSAAVLIAAAAGFAFLSVPQGSATTPPPPPAAAASAEAGGATSARHTEGNLVIEGIPAIPPELNETLLRYQNARSAGFSGWTPGGGMLIATRFGETAQVHRVDSPMGMRRQLTFYAEPVSGGSYPDAPTDGFLFSKDTGGDENFQLYLHKDATGEDIRVSAPGTRNTDAAWSADGKQVAWAISSQENAIYEIWVADIANPDGRRKVLSKEGGSWGPSD